MKYNKIYTYVLVLVMAFVGCFGLYESIITSSAQSLHNKKACWISYEDIYNNLCDKSEEEFRIRLDLMYNNIIKNNMNTVIMHVRTMGDAMYPSAYYPWSTYISSDRSALEYDPLKIMVDMAHDKNLKIEAWINPYRISLGNKGSESFKDTEYYDKYEPFIMEYTNSKGETCMAFNPSKQESIDLITNGVKEIVTNYDVDGVHFDDYFYVEGMAPDLTIDDKQGYVNQLIAEVYATIKNINPECQFGISPAGNISNARAQGADVDTWMSVEGYIDYIMPQIYWSDNYVIDDEIIQMYTNRCTEWMDLNKLDLPIYVGLALYRVGEEGDVDIGWNSYNDNMSSQYKTAYTLGYDGYALFRYAWLEMDIAQEELVNLNNLIECMEGKNIIKNSFSAYTTYVKDYGWQSVKADGIVSGEASKDTCIEAVSIRLGHKAGDGGIVYRTYIKDEGWTPWSVDGDISGRPDEAVSLSAIQIKLKGDVDEKYDIYYRINVQEIGWLDWVKNGMATGASEYAHSIKAIQVVLVPKNA